MRKTWPYLGWMAAASLIFAGCFTPAIPPPPERAPIPAFVGSENEAKSEVITAEVTTAETPTVAQAENQASENTVEAKVASAEALTSAQIELLAGLNGQGAAPELHNETWFNSEPLTLADLRGQVVIVEFWTYG